MKRLDIIIIVLVVATSIATLGILRMTPNGKYEEKYAEISVDGEVIKTIVFDDTTIADPFTIKTELGANIIEIVNGRLTIIEADCPDKLCVKDGPISEPGEILVCLPHKIVVEIKGTSNAEVDELSY